MIWYLELPSDSILGTQAFGSALHICGFAPCEHTDPKGLYHINSAHRGLICAIYRALSPLPANQRLCLAGQLARAQRDQREAASCSSSIIQSHTKLPAQEGLPVSPVNGNQARSAKTCASLLSKRRSTREASSDGSLGPRILHCKPNSPQTTTASRLRQARTLSR